MDANEIINTALACGQTALSEYQSKQILAQYGLPIAREVLTPDSTSALAAAQSIGYPVVLKACSARLMHKSDQGAVTLNLADANQVTAAYKDICTAVDGPLDGVLVQEMISAERELMVGLIRDAQFGPCVMFGLGGVMTEVFKDIVFRMAPVDRIEAHDMISQLRTGAILGPFRGFKPADLDAICHCIMAVGQIGLHFSRIAEIDINPLMLSADGRLTAVDALMILKGDQ